MRYRPGSLTLSRREFAAGSGALILIPSKLMSQTLPQAPALFDAYEAFPHKVDLPFVPGVADCSRLELELTGYRSELVKIKSNKSAAGSALRARFQVEMSMMDERLEDLDAAQKIADWQKAVALAAAIGGGVLFAAGLIFTGPVAVGVGIGVSIVSGTAFLGLQLYRVKTDDTADMIIGYSRDRVVTLTGLDGALRGSPAGQITNNVSGILGVVLSLYSVVDANETASIIRTRADEVKTKSLALRKTVDHLGKLDIVWGSASERIADAAVRGLEAFITQYKASGCRILPLPGPVIGPK